MRVVITAAAKADLIAIRRTIEADNPTRALSFVEELLDRCLALADTPRAYPLVPRYERFGIRRCVHGSYLIFYRLQPEQIEVIHVLQGARSGQGVYGAPAPPMIPPSEPLRSMPSSRGLVGLKNLTFNFLRFLQRSGHIAVVA